MIKSIKVNGKKEKSHKVRFVSDSLSSKNKKKEHVHVNLLQIYQAVR